MAEIGRRAFVAGAGMGGLGLLVGSPEVHAAERALRESAKRALAPDGTTLSQVATPVTSGPRYTRLTAGPGWPLVVRGELAAAKPGRDDSRRALTAFVQFTDLHITDTECPVRFEYLHPFVPSAHRPQETLGPVASTGLVRRVNNLPGAPFTGLPLGFMMTTGDNTDNHERIELSWFLDILNGGSVVAASGDPHDYEGVQDSGSARYWNPDTELDDPYTAKGFPLIPGLLAAAAGEFTSDGLSIPWYCTFGNHDNTPVGTLPANIPGIEGFYTGGHKVIGRDETTSRALAAALDTPGATIPAVDLFGGDDGIVREVTPDQRRAPFSMAEFVAAHLDADNTGPGPRGHGFTDDNADGQAVYYTFRIADGVTGISLDTTTLGGGADGSIGLRQYQWVESVLRGSSSTFYDFWGRKITHEVGDELFILFSHHSSSTMGNPLPDSRHPLEPRLDGEAFVALLNRFPNVLAWVNGHTHRNTILAHAGSSSRQSFWEINTASHIDYPQLARIIEVADNADGTLSLFTTLVESESPYESDYGDDSAVALASLYRELSYNDIHTDLARIGAESDRNTELLLANPLG